MKIELKHVVKKFEVAMPLKDINATINDGDIVALIGPSGTGKSTLLRAINMLDPPTSGEVYVDGLEIAKNRENFENIRQKIGMVFQSFNLFEHLTAVENVMLALTELKHMSRQEAYDIAIEQLAMVGLAERALKYPSELSGGQKQRVSIARALALDPDLILLDEPTSALDPTMVREVEAVICKLAKTGKTMIIVTHEMRLARAISNRIFYLDRGEIYEEGTPDEVFDNPKRERTRAFVNHLKVFKYRFVSNDFDYSEYTNSFSEFIRNNEFDEDSSKKITTLTEEFATEFVADVMGKTIPISIIAEMDSESKKTQVLIYMNAERETVTNLKSLLESLSASVVEESISDKDFNTKLTCIL